MQFKLCKIRVEVDLDFRSSIKIDKWIMKNQANHREINHQYVAFCFAGGFISFGLESNPAKRQDAATIIRAILYEPNLITRYPLNHPANKPANALAVYVIP